MQKQKSLLIRSVAVTFGLIFSAASLPAYSGEAAPSRVTIMTYNVENLFDTVHDENRDDYAYLPLSVKKSMPDLKEHCAKMGSDFYIKECMELDWSDAVLDTKLTRIADVMKQIGNGKGPDIQIFAEVENQRVLEILNKKRLQGMGYQTVVLIEGPDNRGIDPGIISRFPQWRPAKLHLVPYKGKNENEQRMGDRSRGILEVDLLLPDGQKLAVFAVHFPSQSNPGYLREQAITHLTKLMTELPSDVIAVAGGDFNVTSDEDKATGYYDKILRSEVLVSHQVGCKACKGSYYYHSQKQWSFFDVLAFSKSVDASNRPSKWHLDTASIRTPNDAAQQKNKWGEPLRFDPETGFGVSDHWPMYAELVTGN